METQVDLGSLKAVQGGESIDLEAFDKKETKIEKAEVVQVKSDYTESKLQWVLKVSSGVLATIPGEEGKKIEFRASELFNLTQDKSGKLVGYPAAEGSNLAKFMKDIKAKTPAEIVGKTALIKSYEKNDRTYLKFRY